MLLRRLFDDKLAQASYLVACERARLALIVDPNRNLAQYVDAAARDNVKIVAVTETHIHADFLSGARELAERTGAQLYLSDTGGPDWQYRFAQEANAELLTDGSHFMVGDVRVDAIHTPGHTPEHMTFMLTDTASANTPMGALTGDFIFVGDVGRPDLLERAAGMSGTMDAAANQLFQSLQAFKEFPDYLQLWPGHGAGSACGKALGAMPQTTLGYEKLFNWALVESDKKRFVAAALHGQPEPPAYFAIMKRSNRDGPAHTTNVVPPVASADAIAEALGKNADVVDTSLPAEFAVKHAKGSINIPTGKSFLNWSGALLPYDKDVWLIGETSEEARRQFALDLSLIGIHRIAGVFPSRSLDELASRGIVLESSRETNVAGANENKTASVVDVRARSEFDHGHIRGAVNIPLAELPRRLADVPAGPLVVHCQGGLRSAIAASVLSRSGRDDVTNMLGGFGEWERAGNRVERGAVTDGR
ncbi:MAG: MBL fold metallo-hydrolase [Gemmatimonadales bacterium]